MFKAINNIKIFKPSLKMVSERVWLKFYSELSMLLLSGNNFGQAFSKLANFSDGEDPISVEVRRVSEMLGQSATAGDIIKEGGKLFKSFPSSINADSLSNKELSLVLSRLGRNEGEKADIRLRIATTLTYPVALLMISTVILGGLVVFILPIFEEIFLEFGTDLPEPTRLLLEFSDFVLPLAGFIFILCLYLLTLIGKDTFKALNLLSYIFGVNEVCKTFSAYEFYKDMSLMLRLGRGSESSFSYAVENVKVERYKNLMEKLINEKGGSLTSETMIEAAGEGGFLSTRTVGVFIESGSIEENFDTFEIIEEQMAIELKSEITQKLEMVSVLNFAVLGFIIGFIVIALYLPIFSISGAAS